MRVNEHVVSKLSKAHDSKDLEQCSLATNLCFDGYDPPWNIRDFIRFVFTRHRLFLLQYLLSAIQDNVQKLGLRHLYTRGWHPPADTLVPCLTGHLRCILMMIAHEWVPVRWHFTRLCPQNDSMITANSLVPKKFMSAEDRVGATCCSCMDSLYGSQHSKLCAVHCTLHRDCF
jgi:hypothetical protein